MSTKLPAKSSTMFRDPGRTRYSIHAQEELEGPAKVCSPRSKLRWRSLTFSQLGVSKPDQYDGLHIKIRGLYWQYLPSPMVSLEWTNPPMVVVGGALNEDLLEESEARQHELSHKQCPGERSQPAQHLLCPGFVWTSRGTASNFQWFSIMFGNGHEWGYTTVVVTIINTSTSPFQTQPYVLGCTCDSMATSKPVSGSNTKRTSSKPWIPSRRTGWVENCKRLPSTVRTVTYEITCFSSLLKIKFERQGNTKFWLNGSENKVPHSIHIPSRWITIFPRKNGNSWAQSPTISGASCAGCDALPRGVRAQWADGEGHPPTWSRGTPEA